MKIDTSTTTQTTESTKGTGLQGNKDEFLKLFMAQLQHQDPFAPTSGADMVAQLATLSNVEQAKATNEQLAAIAASQASEASAGLASLVGRSCSATAGSFSLDGNATPPPPLSVSSSSPMKGAAVVISDADGKEIRRIPIADGAKTAEVQWDGKSSTGAAMVAGNYTVSVDGGASASSVSAQWQGRVDAVELTGDGPRLRLGGLLVAPGDIRTIGTTSSTTPNASRGVQS